MVTGWYNWARTESVSWWHYQHPLPGELTTRVQKTFDFISDHIENCKAQVVLPIHGTNIQKVVHSTLQWANHQIIYQ
jgi:hypothetical protein